MQEAQPLTVDDLDLEVDDDEVTLETLQKDSLKVAYRAELRLSWAGRIKVDSIRNGEYWVRGVLAHFEDMYTREIDVETESLVDVVHELSYMLYVHPEALVVDEAESLVGDMIPSAPLGNEGERHWR